MKYHLVQLPIFGGIKCTHKIGAILLIFRLIKGKQKQRKIQYAQNIKTKARFLPGQDRC